MRKIEIVASDERLITPSGLSLVGQVLGKSDMIRKANRKMCIRDRYVAEIDIPSREYTETEEETEEGEQTKTRRDPVPLDMDKVTLTLWAV